MSEPNAVPTAYDLKDLERRICDDDGASELGVHLSVRGDHLVVDGQVASAQGRTRVLELVEGCCGLPVLDQLTVAADTLDRPPAAAEELR
ncbi:MAG: hypothetical protein U0Q15_07125 [Kineosporiaceae bacterium]